MHFTIILFVHITYSMGEKQGANIAQGRLFTKTSFKQVSTIALHNLNSLLKSNFNVSKQKKYSLGLNTVQPSVT